MTRLDRFRRPLIAAAVVVTATTTSFWIEGSAQGAGVPPATAQEGIATIARERFPELRGPYLGQPVPGSTPVRFAPGIVSTKGPDGPPRFTPDGKEVYWSHIGADGGVLRSTVQDGRWSYPERVLLGRAGIDALPFLFDNARRLFFLSTRALPDGRRPRPGFFTFWIAAREGAKWGAPTAIESFFSGWDDLSAMAEDGTLYLSAGEKSRVISRVPAGDGRHPVATPLSPEKTGFPALVGPGEQYLIYSSTMNGGFGQSDLYITFRKPDGTWGPSINMGPQINTKAFEHFASLSPDGKYFFFCSERDGDIDVYWMSAAILDELKRQAASVVD